MGQKLSKGPINFAPGYLSRRSETCVPKETRPEHAQQPQPGSARDSAAAGCGDAHTARRRRAPRCEGTNRCTATRMSLKNTLNERRPTHNSTRCMHVVWRYRLGKISFMVTKSGSSFKKEDPSGTGLRELSGTIKISFSWCVWVSRSVHLPKLVEFYI